MYEIDMFINWIDKISKKQKKKIKIKNIKIKIKK